MGGFQNPRIVVPYDFSESALAAVRLAIELTGTSRPVRVLHVMPDWYPVDPAVTFTNYNEQLFKQETLAAMAKKLREAHIDEADIEPTVLLGDPGTRIVEFAEIEGAELIVIPSHGRQGIKRLLLGSVAERVVRLSTCPVLVLKEDH